jgi:hypothetical protein
VEALAPLPDLAQTISGRAFEFSENRMGLRRLELQFAPGSSEAKFAFTLGPAAASLTIGVDGVFRITELQGQRWACRGRWMNGEAFVLEQEAIGKVLRRQVTLNFEGDALNFELRDQITGSVESLRATMVAAVPGAQ